MLQMWVCRTRPDGKTLSAAVTLSRDIEPPALLEGTTWLPYTKVPPTFPWVSNAEAACLKDGVYYLRDEIAEGARQ